MALVILSAGKATESRVRTVSANKLVLALVVLVLVTLGLGVGLGYGLGRGRLEAAPPGGEPVSEPESRFLIDRVGELSGRLMRLESEALLLAKRIGLSRESGVPASAPAPDKVAPAPAKAAEGGPMIPALGSSATAAGDAPGGVGSSLEMLAMDLRRLETTLSTIDEVASSRSLQSMVYPSRLPVFSSIIGSGFGNRRDPINNQLAFHSGLDFPGPVGTPIRASAGGMVVHAGYKGDYGLQIEIDHGNGLVTRYSHASRLRVRAGDLVTPGQHIADIGNTGRSTGAHLHFEVLEHGRFVDPEDYLRTG